MGPQRWRSHGRSPPAKACARHSRRGQARSSNQRHFCSPASSSRISCDGTIAPSSISGAAAAEGLRRVRFRRPPLRGMFSATGRNSALSRRDPRGAPAPAPRCKRFLRRRRATPSTWSARRVTARRCACRMRDASLGFGRCFRFRAARQRVSRRCAGFAAAPCGLGAVAVAGALRVRDPIAAAAFLCVAGIVDARALFAWSHRRRR